METKDKCSENCYKMLMKEAEDDINRWENIPCSWIGRVNNVKKTMLTKAIYRFSIILIKLSMAFFTELEQQKTFNLYGTQKTLNSQRDLEKEKQN